MLTLRRELTPLVDALASTPTSFLHGDWKMGNLGIGRDGRSVLVDWTYSGPGPVCHELGWYLALNRARLPESKEATISVLREALERHGVDSGAVVGAAAPSLPLGDARPVRLGEGAGKPGRGGLVVRPGDPGRVRSCDGSGLAGGGVLAGRPRRGRMALRGPDGRLAELAVGISPVSFGGAGSRWTSGRERVSARVPRRPPEHG